MKGLRGPVGDGVYRIFLGPVGVSPGSRNHYPLSRGEGCQPRDLPSPAQGFPPE